MAEQNIGDMLPAYTNVSADAFNIDVLTLAEEAVEISDIHRGTVDNPFLYDATNQELQKFILINMFVAGKNASVQQAKLNQFIECVRRDLGVYITDKLGVLSAMHNALTSAETSDKIIGWLKEVKSGQYSRLAAGIEQLAAAIGSGRVNLKDCNRRELCKIKGIGLKTASMFLMYTQRKLKVACLDTHILKYLKEEAKIDNVPATTPTVLGEYNRLEREFLFIAQAAGKHPADLDFEIWSRYRSKVNAPAPIEVPTTAEVTI